MASRPVRIFRMSNTLSDCDRAHIGQVQKSIAEAREGLKQAPAVDTFLGRKTQEPFPKEGRRTR